MWFEWFDICKVHQAYTEASYTPYRTVNNLDSIAEQCYSEHNVTSLDIVLLKLDNRSCHALIVASYTQHTSYTLHHLRVMACLTLT